MSARSSSLIRCVWGLLALSLALHLLGAVYVPLIEDESYYALWASAPALGYYDHPPMVAWGIAAGETVAPGRFGVRLVSLLAVWGATALVWAMARRRAGGQAGALAAGLFAWGPLVFALGGVATPDALSLLFWTLCLACLDRTPPGDLESPHPHRTPSAPHGRAPSALRWWLLAGLAAGLGGLAKLSNLALLPGVLLWLLTRPGGRLVLRGPGPWLALAVAAAVLAPWLGWSLAHDFQGISRQLGRLSPGTWSATRPVVTVLTAAILFAPLGVVGLRGRGMLVLTSLPWALVLLWHSLQHPVPANWIAPLSAPAAIMAGVWLAGRPRLAWGSLAGSVGLTLALLAALVIPRTPLITAHTPATQSRGWDATLPQIAARAKEAQASWIATGDYGLTGALWWRRGALRMPVRPSGAPWRYGFWQIDWPGLCDAPALFVTQTGQAPPFDQATPLAPVIRHSGTAALRRYDTYAVRGLRPCPP